MCYTVPSYTVYRATVKQYAQSITLKAGLAQGQQHFYHIVDKFGREWFGNAVTDSAANTAILLTGIDKYIFNRYAGEFKLTIVDSNKQKLPLMFGGKQYNMVLIQFADIRDEFGNLHNAIT